MHKNRTPNVCLDAFENIAPNGRTIKPKSKFVFIMESSRWHEPTVFYLKHFMFVLQIKVVNFRIFSWKKNRPLFSTFESTF